MQIFFYVDYIESRRWIFKNLVNEFREDLFFMISGIWFQVIGPVKSMKRCSETSLEKEMENPVRSLKLN